MSTMPITPHELWNVPTTPSQKIIPWVIMRLVRSGQLGEALKNGNA